MQVSCAAKCDYSQAVKQYANLLVLNCDRMRGAQQVCGPVCSPVLLCIICRMTVLINVLANRSWSRTVQLRPARSAVSSSRRSRSRILAVAPGVQAPKVPPPLPRGFPSRPGSPLTSSPFAMLTTCTLGNACTASSLQVLSVRTQGVTQPPREPEVPPATFGFVDNAERINSRACMVRSDN